MKLKERLGAFIPKHVSNQLVAGVMWLLSMLNKTGRKQTEANRIHNEKVLVKNADSSETRSFFVPGTFIENQKHWRSVRFGSRYTMAYGGCGIFAVYNALIAMGQQLNGKDMVELISEFERKGAVWAGRLGVAPGALYRYFRKRGYAACMITDRDKAKLNALGEEYDTFIVTVYNDTENIFRYIHNVSITRDERW